MQRTPVYSVSSATSDRLGNLVVVLVSMLLGEESRLDFANTIEIEGVSPQHPGELKAATLLRWIVA